MRIVVIGGGIAGLAAAHRVRELAGDSVEILIVDRAQRLGGKIRTGSLAGAPNALRFPFYGTVNVALERRFPFRGYLFAWRVGVVNALNRMNPNVVNNDVNSPAYLTYARGQSRAVNVRLRFLGKK